MCDLIREFGAQFYYIDEMEFSTHSATRLLLSDQDYSSLDVVDFGEYGSPLQRHRWKHAVECRSETYGSEHPHDLEVAIQVNNDDCQWLYDNCEFESNDHSEANTKVGKKYDSTVCHRHNLFGRWCPSAHTKNRANNLINRYYPDLVDDEG